jgi:uncharacterized protein YndB with AHSA1/START domain
MPTEEGVGPSPLVCEVRVAAAPETVFPYFTDPARIVAWKGSEATVNPEPGGIYRVTIQGSHVALGEYVEVDPPRRVVFTWGWEGEGSPGPGASTVEVELLPDGAETLVRLTHRGLSEIERDRHRVGWEHYLGRLSSAAAGRNPGPDAGPGG